MKRIATLLVIGLFFVNPVRAEDAPAAPSTDSTAPSAPATPPAAPPAVPAVAAAPAAAAPVPAPEALALAAPEAANTENLEFISGEVSALDEASKSLTVKLYGETENTPSDKTLKVTVDTNTDITDGEQDRDLKSLTVGTEVDVEYDRASSKATYIFVY